MSIESSILPYSWIVGQQQAKLALELAYIDPRIGGVLLSGHRGTGKSTLARAFAKMVYGNLPVTMPISVTEDRVVGGWVIDELMAGNATPQDGLLKSASQRGMLYVDEINLLDDYIVNIILDVLSTGILVIQSQGLDKQEKLNPFTLVGTMNPEEGWLRPQLLDRFGLMVDIKTETEKRKDILKTMLAFDRARDGDNEGFSNLEEGRKRDKNKKDALKEAQDRLKEKKLSEIPCEIFSKCVELAKAFGIEGHRGEHALIRASRAYAISCSARQITGEHLKEVAPLALQHRRPEVHRSEEVVWSKRDEATVREIVDGN